MWRMRTKEMKIMLNEGKLERTKKKMLMKKKKKKNMIS